MTPCYHIAATVRKGSCEIPCTGDEVTDRTKLLFTPEGSTDAILVPKDEVCETAQDAITAINKKCMYWLIKRFEFEACVKLEVGK